MRRLSLTLAAGTALLFFAACHKSAVTPSVPAAANVPPAVPKPVEKPAAVSVNSPPPPAPAAENPTEKAGILASELQDLHFDYNAGDVRPADQALLQEDASVLKNLFSVDPAVVVIIEGHCDERGSAEYNMALGDRRASVVKGALVNLGVAGDKLTTITYGKERPLCVDSTEGCHARNRRAHFSVAQ